MFKCKHEHKVSTVMKIVDYAKINVKDVNGEYPVVYTGTYDVYRCLDCNCLIWKEMR